MTAIKLCIALPRGPEYRVVGGQLMRCATAVGANYRAACRARSRRDFVAKLGVVEEEADECLYWLDLLRDLGAPGDAQLRMLLDESDQLCAIFVASRKTAKESLRGR